MKILENLRVKHPFLEFSIQVNFQAFLVCKRPLALKGSRPFQTSKIKHVLKVLDGYRGVRMRSHASYDKTLIIYNPLLDKRYVCFSMEN